MQREEEEEEEEFELPVSSAPFFIAVLEGKMSAWSNMDEMQVWPLPRIIPLSQMISHSVVGLNRIKAKIRKLPLGLKAGALRHLLKGTYHGKWDFLCSFEILKEFDSLCRCTLTFKMQSLTDFLWKVSYKKWDSIALTTMSMWTYSMTAYVHISVPAWWTTLWTMLEISQL